MGEPVPEEEKQRIIELRKKGYSIGAIAKKTRHSKSFVHRILKEAGLVGEGAVRTSKNGDPKNDKNATPSVTGNSSDTVLATGKNSENDKPPTVEDAERRIKEYLSTEAETEFEKRFLELEGERQKLIKAARKILAKYDPSYTLSGEREEDEEDEDPLVDFEETLRSYNEKRERMKKLLESMGFKVEDLYMRREEVEKLIDEVKRRAAEEVLEDKRIEAVKDIINNAVNRIISLFSPVIDYYIPKPQQQPQQQVDKATQLVQQLLNNKVVK
jgi:flagellar motility protein MotE (MotC chaperone)